MTADMKAAPPAENALSQKLKSTSELWDFEGSLLKDPSFTIFLSNSTFLVAVATPIHDGRLCLDEPTIEIQTLIKIFRRKSNFFSGNCQKFWINRCFFPFSGVGFDSVCDSCMESEAKLREIVCDSWLGFEGAKEKEGLVRG